MLPVIIAGLAGMIDHIVENHGVDAAQEAVEQIRQALDEHPALQAED